jgi:DNA-binding IclR family transcriptional regulator
MAPETGKRDGPSGALERGLAVLRYFAATGEASAAMVSEALGLSRSATYRILNTLQECRFLEHNPASGRLRLGVGAAELGVVALSEVDVVRLAPSYLHDLVEATLETVFLAVMDDGAMVYIHKEEGPQAIKMSSRLGSRRPLHCTSLGKAYMSALPHDARRSLVRRLDLRRYTANTITDAATLEAELALTEERGYAVDRVEVEEGVGCVGAPVRDYRGLPVAAVSVAGPAERLLPEEERVGPLVRETGRAISRRLGYAKPALG